VIWTCDLICDLPITGIFSRDGEEIMCQGKSFHDRHFEQLI